ncbi:MAG: NADPH:quinone oxidoreductase family protein [Rhodospirillaceae bacterium]|jgi:NADPH:quinone reductase|nr:NADPH:quinone oxidoreductase family protein [Rhodospirillaceae bacterium]
MRALLCHELGDTSSLVVGEIERPPLAAGEVRIGVKASGVNFPDILMVEGKYQVKPKMPFTPGLEVAGEVLECADGIEHVRPGDRVLAFARHGGGHAEEAVVPGEVVTPIPDAMDFVTAAAFPVTYGTAHFGLSYRGRLSAGETLLVLGAAGGVGLAAIEVGKLLGARVIAAASSPEKLATARQHGADETINYATEDLRDRVRALTDGKGVDVVFDPVGGDAFEQSVRCIGWEGRILVVGFASGTIAKAATNMILVKNFSVVGVVFGEHSERFPKDTRERLTTLLKAYDAGHLKPKVMKTYPLEEAATALSEMAGRRVLGKLVLIP